MKKNSKTKSDALQSPVSLPSSLEEILNAVPRGRTTAISYAHIIALNMPEDSPWRNLVGMLRDNPGGDIGHLCDAVGLPQRDFLAEINRELFPVVDEAKKFAHTLSHAVVAQRLPKVVERGMIEAGKPDGIADRHFILQKEGYHIAPKGTAINIQQVNQQASGLPVFEDEVKEIADILDEDIAPADHQLGPGTGDYINVEDEVEEDVAA